MNIAVLQAHADRLVRTPADVAKLRQLILSLAVQGKLVAQEDGEWPEHKLKELTTKIGSGSTPQGGKQSYAISGIPLIRSMNVYNGKFVYDGLAYLTDEQATKLDGVTVQNSDVLLNITGASIGRVTVVPVELVGARVNQHVCILRPKRNMIPKYLDIVLASPIFQSMIDDVQVGATREALTKVMIESFIIPLPPLAEQERIVARVDELMGWCDRLEEQLRTREELRQQVVQAALAELQATPSAHALAALLDPRIGARASDLRQAILSLAVQGKLVAQEAGDGDISEFLQSIWSDKNDIRQQINPIKNELFNVPVSWSWVYLGEIISFRIGKTPNRAQQEYWSNAEIPWVSIADLNHCGEIEGTKEKISVTAAQQVFGGKICEAGSILMSFKLTIGKISRTKMNCFHNEAIISFQPVENALSDYLFYILPFFANAQTKKNAVMGSTLNKNSLIEITIPLPPLAEQERIVARVDELMALIDQLEAQQQHEAELRAQVLEAVVG